MKTAACDYSIPPYDLASPWRRIAAAAIDLLLVYLTIRVADSVPQLIGTLYPRAPWPATVQGVYLFFFALATLYFLFCDALPHGQSIGKRLLKISVVGFPFQTRCTLLQSALRNVPKFFLSLLDAILMFFGYRRRLGDMLASTMVINSKPVPKG